MLPQGPLMARSSSLAWFKWKLTQAHVITNDIGQVLDLTIGSPAMLKHYLSMAYTRRGRAQIEHTLMQRGCCLPEAGLNWDAITKIMRGRKIPPKIKATILDMLHGTTPTCDWLWGHGWQIDRTCSCTEVDNLSHILAGCGFDHLELEGKWLRALAMRDPLAKENVKEHIWCFINGFPCPWDDFTLTPALSSLPMGLPRM